MDKWKRIHKEQTGIPQNAVSQVYKKKRKKRNVQENSTKVYTAATTYNVK